jgi:hypothetical protein
MRVCWNLQCLNLLNNPTNMVDRLSHMVGVTPLNMLFSMPLPNKTLKDITLQLHKVWFHLHEFG